MEPLNKKHLQEICDKVVQDLAERDKFIDMWYAGKKHWLNKLYYYYEAGADYLRQFCTTPEFVDLFLGETDLFRTSRDAMQKRENYRENTLYGCYELELPQVSASKSRLDVTRRPKPVPEDLEDLLKEMGFEAEKVVDLEFFEYIHQDEFYESSGIVRALCEDHGISNKDTAQVIAEEGIFWDREKLHIIYVVGKHAGQRKCLPIYIGFGSNEPYGFRFKTENGKKRFYRKDLTKAKAYEEIGVLTLKKVSQEDFFAGCNDAHVFELEETRDRQTIIGYVVDYDKPIEFAKPVPPRKYHPHFDEDRFKGFAMYNYTLDSEGHPAAGNFLGQVVSGFDTTPLNRRAELSRMLAGNWTNRTDILDLLERCTQGYDRFFNIHFNPHKMVSEVGVRQIFEHLKAHSALDSLYVNIDNLASDLYVFMSQGNFRIKKAALVAGVFAASGKLDEIVLNC